MILNPRKKKLSKEMMVIENLQIIRPSITIISFDNFFFLGFKIMLLTSVEQLEHGGISNNSEKEPWYIPTEKKK